MDRVGAVWVARPEAEAGPGRVVNDGRGRITLDIPPAYRGDRILIPETYDPGWRAQVDGKPAAVGADRGAFLAAATPPGARRVALRYDPPEVRLGAAISLAALAAIGLAAARPGPKSPRSRPG